MRRALTELFANARGVDLLFFFAGHGAQTAWGADLVTQDAAQHSLGISMNDLVTLANDSPANSVTLLLETRAPASPEKESPHQLHNQNLSDSDLLVTRRLHHDG